MDGYKLRTKGSAYADAMVAGYIRTDFICDECSVLVEADDERPRCPECGEYAEAVMVTKYGRFLNGEKL